MSYDLRRSYEPYRREAWHSFLIDLILSIGMAVVLFLIQAHKTFPWLFLAIPALLLLELFFNYFIVVLSWVEIRLHLFCEERIRLIRIKEEFVPSGRLGSVLDKLYPKALLAERDILVVSTPDNRSMKLRCAFGGNEPSSFGRNRKKEIHKNKETDPDPLGESRIVYGKLTHIILSWDGKRFVSNTGLWDRGTFPNLGVYRSTALRK